jgi:hypothetical protein
VFNGMSVKACVFRVLGSYMPTWRPRFVWNSGGSSWSLVFQDTRALAELVVNVDDMTEKPEVVSLNIERNISFTRVKIEGDYANVERTDIYDPNGDVYGSPITDMSDDWDTDLEATWTPEDAEDYPDTYGRVWRCYTLSQDSILQARIGSSTGPMAFAWYSSSGLTDSWVLRSIKSYDPSSGAIEFVRPNCRYDDEAAGYVVYPIAVRFAYRGARIVGLHPNADYSGGAATAYSIARTKHIIDEDFKKLSITGIITDEAEDAVIDRLMQATPGKLIGATLTYDGNDYEITANGTYKIVPDSTSITFAAGDAYTITFQDDSAEIDLLAQELHAELSEIGASGEVRIPTYDPAVYHLGIYLTFNGWPADVVAFLDDVKWVVTRITHQPIRQSCVLSLSTLTSMGARHEYALLKDQLLKKALIEEHEIQIGRLRAAPTEVSDATDDEFAGIGDHKHSAVGDGGLLSTTETLWDDETHQDVLSLVWDTDEEKFYCDWKDSQPA